MALAYELVTSTIKTLTTLLCNVEDAQLAHVPARGPLILATNHINFLDIPVIYTHLRPRPLTGLVKVETWDNPWLARLFNLWGAIPIRRGEADRIALRRALEALSAGQILAIAPEGTRSGDGRLRPGHPGIVSVALHSDAPILPLVYFGGEKFKRNLPRLRRTDFHIRVGQPFVIQLRDEKPNRQVRQQITEEIMYQIACLLPSEYRGVYGDLNNSKTNYLRLLD